MRAVPRFVLAALLAASALAHAHAQPKAPRLLIGGTSTATADAHGDLELAHVFDVSWQHGMPMFGGWWRVDYVPPGFEGRVVVQGFARADRLLVDVFNVGPDPLRLAFADPAGAPIAGDTGEYDRTVPPWCGIAWSSAPPTKNPDGISRGEGPYDAAYAPPSWAKVDVWYTPTAGSPRQRFYSGHQLRAGAAGVSPAMEAWLDRWTRAQLMRPYQGPDAARGFPRVVIGQDPIGGAYVNYPGIPGVGYVTPTDTHHHTIGILLDAFLLAGNPRALDQAVRLERWVCATADYYDPSWPWPYGGAERVPGWLLVSLADYGEMANAAGLDSEAHWAADFAAQHVATLHEVGFNELGLPGVANAPDARHIKAWFNAPWQGATVWWGLRRVEQVLGVPGAAEEADAWRAYVVGSGWSGGLDGAPREAWPGLGHPVVYDAIPNHLEDQGVLPSKAGVPGIGMWLAAPLQLDGVRLGDAEPPAWDVYGGGRALLEWLADAQEKQTGGLFASLGLFGPLAFGKE